MRATISRFVDATGDEMRHELAIIGVAVDVAVAVLVAVGVGVAVAVAVFVAVAVLVCEGVGVFVGLRVAKRNLRFCCGVQYWLALSQT